MSVINFVQDADRIHLITDGIIHGKPQVTSKVIPLPHLNCAVAAFGNVGAGAVLPIFAAALGSQVQSFEGAIVYAADIVRDCQRDFPALVPTPKVPELLASEPHFQLTVAGIIDQPFTLGDRNIQRGPLVFEIQTSNNQGEPYKPFLYQQGALTCFQPAEPRYYDELGRRLGGKSAYKADPAIVAAVMIEIQREAICPTLPDTIGGFAQLTTIRRDGITSRIVKRWPEHLAHLMKDAA